jgi:hypothetical protein
MKGSDVSLEWIDSDPDALKEPIVIETPDGLGMKMPGSDFTVQDVAETIGEDHPVEVIGMYPLLCTLSYLRHARCGNAIQQSWLDCGQMGEILQHSCF